MKKLLVGLLWLFACVSGLAQAYGELPAGYIGTVNQTATNTYQLFSYSWTATTSGANYFGIALRQDPGYWSVGSFKLTAQGSGINLLSNPNLQYGGTTNTQYGLQAPADWGLWYQSGNGAPPAAGMYYAPGSGWMGSTTLGGGVNTSTAGSWIDGAVGTYDGIYQGFSATAGTTYNFSFYSAGTNPYSNPSIMIGIYAGACASGSSIFTCTPSNTALTAAATPQQTQGTGGAPPPSNGGGTSSPTVVSTSTTNQTSTSVSYGNPTSTNTQQNRTVNTTDAQGWQVTYTYIDIVTTTTTPRYTTTTTTPVTTTTWSDGTTTTSNGTPTTSTVTDYVTTSSTSYASTPSSTAPWLCCGGSAQTFNAPPAKVNQVQNFANRTTDDSRVFIEQIGSDTKINVNQTGTRNNYVYYSGHGSNNTVNVNQSGNSSTVANYVSAVVNGNHNTVDLIQSSTGGAKAIFASVSDSNNSLTVSQTGAGNHYADIALTGGNKTVNLAQSGSASHMASITLSGTPTSLTLQQNGSVQQSYSIQFNCATSGGCAPIAVKQGN